MDKKTYLQLLEDFPGKRVAVIGDFLLDQYIVGNSTRVSREAPIVVVDYQETVNHPGGAANAAQNIAALGATAVAVGVIGDDREGDALRNLLSERGVDTETLRVDASAETSVKLRIIAGELNAQKQQVARVDRSHRLSLPVTSRKELDHAAAQVVERCDAVLFSDYGMGLVPGALSEALISTCRSAGRPVIVDSRFDLFAYKGATTATPNEVEALAALGRSNESDLTQDETARDLIHASGIESFVVTRGSKGMVVCDASGIRDRVGIVGGQQATDVTGAGDTVSAVVSLSLACGATVEVAARMATYAASVVVMKRGTATASCDELRHAVTTLGDPEVGK